MVKYTFYCNCFEEHENKKSQFDQKNLMCGSLNFSDLYKKELQQKNFYFDDTKNNISHLNKWLGDLTGLYWVWKNTDDEIVGTNQYRRFWNEEEINNLNFKKNIIYVSSPCIFNVSIANQYVTHHGEIGGKILYEVIKNKKINFTLDMFDDMNKINVLSPCNMFFCERENFNRLCSILFEIIFEIYEGCKYSLPYIQEKNQTRMLAFLAERILTMIYFNSKKYFGEKISIQGIGWEVI
jgi:hypothetical protein